MKDYKQLAKKSIETLLDRGMDFLVEEAKTFVKDKNLHEFSKSQIYGLYSEVDKGENLADFKKGVEAWLRNQSKKKTGTKWKDIKDELLKKMFEWDKDRIKNVSNLAQKLLKEERFEKVKAIDTFLTENLTEDLKLRLAKNFFYAVLAFYRCYEDEEIREKLEG